MNSKEKKRLKKTAPKTLVEEEQSRNKTVYEMRKDYTCMKNIAIHTLSILLIHFVVIGETED